MQPTFTPFKLNGKQYLAVSIPHGVHIIDTDGNNYGSCFSIENAKDYLRSGEMKPLGSAALSVHAL